MPRPVSVCHACGERIQRKNPKFCPECQAPLNADEYQKWIEAGNKPMPDGWKKPEPTPDPEPKNEEDTDMDKNNHNHFNPWWIIALVAAIIAAVLITLWVSNNERDKALQADRIASLEAQVKNPAATYVSETDAAVLAAAANTRYAYANANTINYDGWEKEQIKDLQPGWTACGDVEAEGVIYYDVGGVNEATVVVNRSSSTVRVYAPYAAGEKPIDDFTNKELAKYELDHGGDPDASSVRIVEFTDNEVVQTWYRYKNGIITLVNTKVDDR